MGVLDLTKYLMFVFNVLAFSIIVPSPLLNVGAYLIVLVGVALAFLGFLGCFGAIKENGSTSLLLFLLVLLVFSAEIVAATLILVSRKQFVGFLEMPLLESWWALKNSIKCLKGSARGQIKAGFLLSDLQRNYQGDNASDVFSTSWNTIMIAEQRPDELWPRACCTQDKPLHTGHLLDWKHCRQRDPEYLNSQMFAMIFAFCLYRYYDRISLLGLEK